MTYRRYLIALLTCTLLTAAWMTLAETGIWRQILAAAAPAVLPEEPNFAFKQIYVEKDGTLYFVGEDNKVWIRDPDGNFRTIPAAAFAEHAKRLSAQ